MANAFVAQAFDLFHGGGVGAAAHGADVGHAGDPGQGAHQGVHLARRQVAHRAAAIGIGHPDVQHTLGRHLAVAAVSKADDPCQGVQLIDPVLAPRQQQIGYLLPAHIAMGHQPFLPFHPDPAGQLGFQLGHLGGGQLPGFIHPHLAFQHRGLQQLQGLIHLIGFRAEVLIRSPLLLPGLHDVEVQPDHLGRGPGQGGEGAQAHPQPATRFPEKGGLGHRLGNI